MPQQGLLPRRAEAGAAVALVDRDGEQVGAAVARTVETLGGLDMAFNNAGIQVRYAGSADETVEDFDPATLSTTAESGPR